MIRQDPNRDTFVDPGTTVTITVSTGKPMTTVPPIVGRSRSEARAALEEAHLIAVFDEMDSDEPKGQVVETDPAAGEEVPEGTKITVWFSDGPEKVPNVVGMTQEEAEQTLADSKGSIRSWWTSDDTTEPKGTVIEQIPDAGEEQPEGSR